ncbi:MAG: hypothetical protein HZA93_06840 [Verrucomicrobia bacterium]|nr:hypothetical protein [Verrucomicrobiota bacterium]
MMNFFRVLLAGGLAAVLPALAVYAPVPEKDQGKALTVKVKSALSYDSNIFGGATGAIESSIFQVVPGIAYNASVTDQMFVSLAYELTLDHYDNRPGDKLLDSHMAMARLARAMSPTTTVDFVELFMAASSPESLLNGLPLNADQSMIRNEVDGTLLTSLNPKLGASLKARTVYNKFRNAILGRSLDRIENLYGLSVDFAALPEVKVVGELRHQDVFYRKLGEVKNKRSDFVMGGVDYALAKKMTASARAGAEWRHRSSERSAAVPYVEVTSKYTYAPESFITAGYMLTIEETSDTARFTDTRVNRFILNLQHHFTPLIAVSAGATFEPSVIKGRRGQASIDEDTGRYGVALTYLPTKNWVLTGSIDFDKVNSGEASRGVERTRYALTGSYTF